MVIALAFAFGLSMIHFAIVLINQITKVQTFFDQLKTKTKRNQTKPKQNIQNHNCRRYR